MISPLLARPWVEFFPISHWPASLERGSENSRSNWHSWHIGHVSDTGTVQEGVYLCWRVLVKKKHLKSQPLQLLKQVSDWRHLLTLQGCSMIIFLCSDDISEPLPIVWLGLYYAAIWKMHKRLWYWSQSVVSFQRKSNYQKSWAWFVVHICKWMTADCGIQY